jgi:glycosyltransferase involved in cell wall biosynthesis
MKIEVYAICYNEEKMLPYFIRHYSQFANIIIYDNYSTDKSEEIAIKGGAKVIKYDSNGELRDDIYLQIKNNCWKSSKADWAIVGDCDEFVYHPNLINVLENTDSTAYDLKMYNMYSLKFPTTSGQIYDEVKMGVAREKIGSPGKMLLFKPSEITDINYSPGCHSAKPKGNVKINAASDIKFLHMRYLSKEYLINRYAEYNKRLSNINKQHDWGGEYQYSVNRLSSDFDNQIRKIIKVI